MAPALRAGAPRGRNETNQRNEINQASKPRPRDPAKPAITNSEKHPKRSQEQKERSGGQQTPTESPTPNPRHIMNPNWCSLLSTNRCPSDRQGQQVLTSRFRPGGRRPIVARLRRADGRAYGRPDFADLRFFAYLKLGLSALHPGQIARFLDRGGMDRNGTPTPAFFTERTLATYLAVSDRTIRNWIRRGELASYKLGAARRIDPADVDAFLAQRRELP